MRAELVRKKNNEANLQFTANVEKMLIIIVFKNNRQALHQEGEDVDRLPLVSEQITLTNGISQI